MKKDENNLFLFQFEVNLKLGLKGLFKIEFYHSTEKESAKKLLSVYAMKTDKNISFLSQF